MNDIIKTIKPRRCSHHTVSMGRCQNCGHDYQAPDRTLTLPKLKFVELFGYDPSITGDLQSGEVKATAEPMREANELIAERNEAIERADEAEKRAEEAERALTDEGNGWEDMYLAVCAKRNEAIRAREIALRDLRKAQAENDRLRGDR